MSLRDRAQYMRGYRERKKPTVAVLKAPRVPADLASSVAWWSAHYLVVPPGHPRAGAPMRLPGYGLDFLRDVFRGGVREALLCLARKNAKSSIIAVLLLAYLAGPLRRFGFRAGVASVSRAKAGELKRLCKEIAEASKLDGIKFLRSPAPGRIESPFGSVDVLAAEASGFRLMPVSVELDIKGLEELQSYLTELENKFDTVVGDALMGMSAVLLQRFRSQLPRRSGHMQSTAKTRRVANGVELSADVYYKGQQRRIKVDAEKLVSQTELAQAIKKQLDSVKGSPGPTAPKKTFL